MVVSKSFAQSRGARSQPAPVSRNTTVADESRYQAEDQNSNIKVVVRVRPPSQRENEGNFRSVVNVVDNNSLVFDPNENNEDFFYHGCRQTNRDITKRVNKNTHFAFHRVFGEDSTNQQVFSETTKEIVDSLLDGFNCSVFAYGATGAGKTHTMIGKPDSPGITFLTLMELYRRMEDLKSAKRFEVAVSYIEVYNENVRDLLGHSTSLFIRDNGNDGITISGLTMPRPGSPQELLSLLEHGNKNRTQHPTDHNAESSRSHAVFQVWVKQFDRLGPARNNTVKVAKMSLIDLAGSERGSATGHIGERFREGNNINKSLLALGNCINALVEGRKHVPYRDSKLTRLLRDSLGGNCKTVMIAAVSPSSISFEDTYNTLKYAERAKKIKNLAKKNERTVQLAPWQYEQQLRDLREELAAAKEKLRVAEQAALQVQTVQTVVQTPFEIPAELLEIRNQLATLSHERREILHRVACLDNKERQLKLKVQQKQLAVDRLALIALSSDKESKVRQRLDRELALQKPKLEALGAQKAELETRLAHNFARKQELQNLLEQSSLDGILKELLSDSVRMKELEVVVQSSNEVKLVLEKAVAAQAIEQERTETLVQKLLKAYRESHLLLRGTDASSSYLVQEFQAMVTLVEGGRGVSWADETQTVDSAGPEAVTAEVVLSPLTENDQIRMPHTSVLLTCPRLEPEPPRALDSTYTQLPDDEEQSRSLSETFVRVDMAQKENIPVNRVSPNVAKLLPTAKVAPKLLAQTHKLQGSNSISRSTGDLSSAVRTLQSRQNYMAATSSSKLRVNPTVPTSTAGQLSALAGAGHKFKAPLSKLKKSVSSLALTPTRSKK